MLTQRNTPLKFPYDLREDATISAKRPITALESASGRRIFVDVIDCADPTEFIVRLNTLHGVKTLKMRKVDRWRGWWSYAIDDAVSEFNRMDMMRNGDPVWEYLKSICLKGTEWLAYRIKNWDADFGYSDDHRWYRAGYDEMQSIRKEVAALGPTARKSLIGVPQADLFGIKA